MIDRLYVLEPFGLISEYAEANGMDVWLDHLETLSRAMEQRRMTPDQRG